MAIKTSEQQSKAEVKQPAQWQLFGLLLVASLVATLLVIPYSLSLAPLSVPIWLVVIGALVQTLIFSTLALAIGLWLGTPIGLGAPVLQAWLAGDRSAGQRLQAALPWAIGLGAAAGAILIPLGYLFLPLLSTPPVVHPPAWQGFLAAIQAGINEEIWLRLGVMTLLAWLAVKLLGHTQVSAGVVWTSNLLAALAFGAAHLPLAATLGAVTWPDIAWVLGANGLVGLVFGWLYWRYGLLAAMIAHFSADVVLHTLAPLLGLIR